MDTAIYICMYGVRIYVHIYRIRIRAQFVSYTCIIYKCIVHINALHLYKYYLFMIVILLLNPLTSFPSVSELRLH